MTSISYQKKTKILSKMKFFVDKITGEKTGTAEAVMKTRKMA